MYIDGAYDVNVKVDVDVVVDVEVEVGGDDAADYDDADNCCRF